MKIALCLSGLPRCFDYHHDTYLNLFPPHKVDVFMHLWDDNLTDKMKDDLINAWKPNDIIFEHQPKELFSKWINDTHHIRAAGRFHGNAFPMRYSILKANQLKSNWEQKHGFKYDAVCKLRTDFWFKSTWTDALTKLEPNTIIIPGDFHHNSFQDYDGGYNDALALGDSESMDKFADIWNWFPTALEHKQVIGYEVMLRNYLDNWAKMQVKRHFLDFKIVRPDERFTPYEKLRGSTSIPPPDNEIIISMQ